LRAMSSFIGSFFYPRKLAVLIDCPRFCACVTWSTENFTTFRKATHLYLHSPRWSKRSFIWLKEYSIVTLIEPISLLLPRILFICNQGSPRRPKNIF